MELQTTINDETLFFAPDDLKAAESALNISIQASRCDAYS